MHRRQATDDDMIVTDLARMYQTATGRALQRAIVEGSPYLHERKAGHVDDYTHRTVRKAWEGLGREPEPWMHAEGAATMLEALLQEQDHPGQGCGAERDDLSGGLAKEERTVHRVVVAAGAVVALGGLVAAARQPTRTPGSARRLTPPATPRVVVVRGPQEPRGTPRPQGVSRLAGVEYVRESDTVRLCSGGHGILVACPRGKRAIAGVRGGPWPVERMVRANRQPGHAAACRVGRGGLCRDVVTAGRRGPWTIAGRVRRNSRPAPSSAAALIGWCGCRRRPPHSTPPQP